jgi:hypothetical protein
MFTVTFSAQTVQGNGSPREREAPPKCRVVCVHKFALRFLLGAKINRGIRISPNEKELSYRWWEQAWIAMDLFS